MDPLTTSPPCKKGNESRRIGNVWEKMNATLGTPISLQEHDNQWAIAMFDTSTEIRALNSLIATTLDSAAGYTEAAKESDGGRYTDLFTARASERRSVVSQLQGEVVRLGGKPEDDGTVLASAHRTFLDLKAAVTGRDDKAIVNEVERGEDHILHKFEAAMKEDELSPETRAAILTAFGSIKTGHDQMRDLKHAMEATRS